MAFKFTKLMEKTINKLLVTLLTACTTRVQYPICGVTLRATPTQLLRERPTRNIHMRTRSDLGTALDHNLTLVAHTKLKTRMGSNKLARQSFGVFKIRKYRILLELCLWNKKEERR